MKGIWTLAIVAVLATACSNEQKSEDAGTEVVAEQAAPSLFGEEFNADGAADINSIDPSSIAESDSLDAVVYGTVKEVCQVKGCWMTVVSDADTSQVINVRFKDYGFFVPKEGQYSKDVIMKGVAKMDTLTVQQLRHYAEDAGKSQEEIDAITAPEISVNFTAEGVLIAR